MGQYEPRDSRDVTLKPGHEPGDITRTGPREGETRQGQRGDAKAGEPDDDARVDTPPESSWEGERQQPTPDGDKTW